MMDTLLSVQEVCCQISAIKQVYSLGGKVRTDTPDELFDKFTSLSVSLPGDTNKWSIQLCSSFLLALPTDLSKKITTESGFVMPNLTTLISKALQLDALRDIHRHA